VSYVMYSGFPLSSKTNISSALVHGYKIETIIKLFDLTWPHFSVHTRQAWPVFFLKLSCDIKRCLNNRECSCNRFWNRN